MKRVQSLYELPAVCAYLTRINARPDKMLTAVVEERTGPRGYWKDRAIIRFSREGDVDAPERYEPTDFERKSIAEEFGNTEFPHSIPAAAHSLPDKLRDYDKLKLFPFLAIDGRVLMILQRIDLDEGSRKKYIPWTYFDDQQWRNLEPDGKLPLMGLDQFGSGKPVKTVAFLHEGPKGAVRMRKLLEDTTSEGAIARALHPWIKQLEIGHHFGWHGGALNPGRTELSVLKANGITHVIIVPDNDDEGKSAVPKLAEQLKSLHVQAIWWDDRWRYSFDLGDEWVYPHIKREDLVFTPGPIRNYIGPAFEEMTIPATYATDPIPGMVTRSKKQVYKLRDEFIAEWGWAAKPGVYVNLLNPAKRYDAETFNKLVKPFSDVEDTAAKLHDHISTMSFGLSYRPDHLDKKRLQESEHANTINTFTPARIEKIAGDVTPFLNFMKQLVADPKGPDLHELMRYAATLIAKPEIRMLYSVLMISELQGIGKTTFGAHILAPLVGYQNVSTPSEHVLAESQFNAWVGHKRLIVVAEIYAGHNWRTYHKLKPYVSDHDIEVHAKYMDTYRIQNWAHFICSSNDYKALKIDNTDRRWFIPGMRESFDTGWSVEQFKDFYRWLHHGGLQYINWWAHNFENLGEGNTYIGPADRAPASDTKRRVIEESASEAVKLLISFCEAQSDTFKHTLPDQVIRDWLHTKLRRQNQEKIYETPLQLRNVMALKGWLDPCLRISHDGQMTYVMIPPLMIPPWKKLLADKTKAEVDARQWLRENAAQSIT